MALHPGKSEPDHAKQTPSDIDPIQRALQENGDWNRDLVEHSQDLLCVHDLRGRLLSVNPAPARVLGYSVEEILKIPMREIIVPEFREAFDAYLEQIAAKGEAHGFMAVLTRTGERRIWEFHNTLRTEGVATPIVRGMAHDVTERLHAEGLLREANSNLSRAQRVAHIGSWSYDVQAHRVAFSEETYRIVGLPIGSPIGAERVMEIIHPDDRSSVVAAFAEALAKGHYDFENRIAVAGEVRWLHTRADIQFGADGKPATAVGTVQDITDRRAAEANRLLLASIVRSASDAIFSTTIDGIITSCNAGAERMYGYSPAELMGKPLITLVPPECQDEYRAVMAQALQGQPTIDLDTVRLRKDDTRLNVSVTASPIQDGAGAILGASVVHRDITQRKRGEEELRRTEQAIAALIRDVRHDSSEGFFSSMVQQLAKCLGADHTLVGELVEGQDAVMTLAAFSRGVTVDNFAYSLVGTPCAEVMDRGICSYAQGVGERFPEDPLLGRGNIKGYVGTPLLNSQGRAIGIMVALYERRLEDPRFAESILQLFSARTAAEIDRMHAEMARRVSEAELRAAQRVGGMGSWYRDLKSGVFTCSEQLNRMLGLAPNARPLSTEQARRFFAPEDEAKLAETADRFIATGQPAELEVEFRRSDGSRFWAFLHRELDRDETGKPVGIRGIALDITERRRIEDELRAAKEKLAEEKLYLEQEISRELGLEEIVGQSKALKDVMEQVRKVASSDATVLLLGETGTGKELIARAVHRLSSRRGGSFIKMNCAAIPSGLLESELFGHEKGAFTGAVGRKIGRIELADKGTLFLDEIGEIAQSLQPKLLRVLQDQEFERLGSTRTLKVNFRLIAATNRDLPALVRQKQFRSDLYYRLSVFPVRVPPLRERREDIPLLVEHAVARCARRMNKSIASIPKTTIDALTLWDWPGNVRELENFMERSVILTRGSVLQVPLGELQAAPQASLQERAEDAERERILRILQETNGRIRGNRGAAARLGMLPSALLSKLKRLRIDPSHYHD